MKTIGIFSATSLALGLIIGYFINGGDSSKPVNSSSELHPITAQAKIRDRDQQISQLKQAVKKLNGEPNVIISSDGAFSEIQHLINNYSNFDGPQCLAEFNRLKELPKAQRDLALSLLFKQWAETDPSTAIESTKFNFTQLAKYRNDALAIWVAKDANAAATWFNEAIKSRDPESRNDRYFYNDISTNIAKNISSTSDAIAFVSGLEDSSAQKNAYQSIFNELIKGDQIDQAKALLPSLDAANQKEIASKIAKELSQDDTTSALKWIYSLPEDQQELAIAESMKNFSRQDPDQAITLFNELNSDEAIKESLYPISKIIVERDGPIEAAKWILETAPEIASKNYQPLYNAGREAAGEPDNFLNWVNQSDQGRALDFAIYGFLRATTKNNDYEAQAIAAESLSRGSDRDQKLRSIINKWEKTDAQAAQTFINTSQVINQ